MWALCQLVVRMQKRARLFEVAVGGVALEALHDGALQRRGGRAAALPDPGVLQRLRRTQPLGRLALQQPLRTMRLPSKGSNP